MAHIQEPNSKLWHPQSTHEKVDSEKMFVLNIEQLEALFTAFIDGTLKVGNSAKLDGKGADEYVLVEGISLSTSILDYALTLDEGEFFIRLSGSSYSGNDLPDNNYAFGSAKIYKRGAGAITVSLLGSYSATLRRITSNYYNGLQWSGWNDEVITSDLANYFPLSGGTVEVIDWKGFIVKRTNSTNNDSLHSAIMFANADGLLGGIGYEKSTPILLTPSGMVKGILLHTGNMADHVLPITIGNLSWTELTSGFDLNNALGRYRTSSSIIVSSLINKPSNLPNGEITVEWFPSTPNDLYGTQIIKSTRADNHRIYTRQKQNNTWDEWFEFLHTGNSAPTVIKDSVVEGATATEAVGTVVFSKE